MKNNFLKNKKSIVRVILVLAVLLLISLSLVIVARCKLNSENPVNKGKVIAVADGMKIYEGDIVDRLNSLSGGKEIKLEAVPQNILKAMVLEVVVNNTIDKESKKLGYQKDPEIVSKVEDYKKGLVREKYLNDNIYSKVTNQDVLNEYNRIVSSLKGKEERKVKHILVENEDEINRVRRTVLRTGNFEKIAQEKSIDKASAQKGGDLGYVLKEELVPEFGDMAFILKVGEVSKPVKTQYGWHIIKVEDVRQAQFLPFDDVKDNIKSNLQQQFIQKFLLSLTKDVNIDLKVNAKVLKEAPKVENSKVDAITADEVEKNNDSK
ncbi:MAG: peptidylprolyl isomerase [Rickettsiales bacterium]|nr:peptidylprolyl isomerase [Rickettsiales bacterium]